MIRLAAMLAAVLLAASHVRAQDPPAEPEGYRTEDYRAAVPATLAGARVLTTAEAAEIWRNKSGAFVDVLPRAPKPNLPAGTVWRERPHRDIPGSIWLPDTGYGKLAASTEDYMRRGLVRASGDDKARLLVIYCQENCWMSWNAAKRVLSYGYRNVAWYPEGTDGWGRANLPLADVEPEPREGEQ
jgi:PQQ-dependent catabolism-associated CXXCW motif protein